MDCTPPMEWYEPIGENEPDGWFHKDEYDVLSAKDYLDDLITAFYKTGSMEDMEKAIDELASCLKVTYEIAEPQFEVKNKNRLMHWYLGYQRATIDHMKGVNNEI